MCLLPCFFYSLRWSTFTEYVIEIFCTLEDIAFIYRYAFDAIQSNLLYTFDVFILIICRNQTLMFYYRNDLLGNFCIRFFMVERITLTSTLTVLRQATATLTWACISGPNSWSCQAYCFDNLLDWSLLNSQFY